MIICYYRDESGVIVSYHGGAEGYTLEKLKIMAQEYNDSNKAKKAAKRTAFVEEVPDDSLTAYLFRRADERRKWDKDEIQGAVDAIEQALDAVRGLGV